ncbi:MAG: hypothetical protein ACJ75H_00045 [Thermoanaerobaculia bacterium]
MTSGLRVVFDTDFLSAFLKIDRLDLVRRFFQVEAAFVPPAVYREIARTDLLEKLVAVPWIQVQGPEAPGSPILSDDPDLANLGLGEREAIALAAERAGSTLLTNDNKARSTAVRRGVVAITIPAFLLACKDAGVASRDEISRLVTALEERDHYGFRKDVRERLLS